MKRIELISNDKEDRDGSYDCALYFRKVSLVRKLQIGQAGDVFATSSILEARQLLNAGFRIMPGPNVGATINGPHEKANKWLDVWRNTPTGRLAISLDEKLFIDDCRDPSRPLLSWCAGKQVPVILWIGFRFLFPDDPKDPSYVEEVSWIKPHGVKIDKKFSWKGQSVFPHDDIRTSVKRSGVEIWTGAGWADGLKHGSLAKAEAFGFKGVLTSAASWKAAGM